MISEVRTQATVQPGGIVAVRSDELPEGATVEVIVLVKAPEQIQRTPLEVFEELGLVGCIEDGPSDLSTSYKPMIQQYIEEKYEREQQ